MLTRMARLLTRMARMARMLTRMTRWLAYCTHSIEIIGSGKEWNKISNNISDRTYTKVRFGWLEDRTSLLF